MYAAATVVVHATTDGSTREMKIADSMFPVFTFTVVDRFKGDPADSIDVIVAFDAIDYSSGEAVIRPIVQPEWHYILYLNPLQFGDGEPQAEYVPTSGSLGVFVRPPASDGSTFFAIDSEFPFGHSVTLEMIRSETKPAPELVALPKEEADRVVEELSAICVENRSARADLRERLTAVFAGAAAVGEVAELAATFAAQTEPYRAVVDSIADSHSTMLVSLNSGLEVLDQGALLLSVLATDAVDDALQFAQLASHVSIAGTVLQSWGVTGCEDMLSSS